ncbi:MAG: peptide deformylase [Dehalococcoidia bacterium]|nr:peptide deformylase [Dehalococcoidia bacterium]|tara:strand:+ start:334 stop:840 length:507 start_codon:yes stop_codon:yes gene_type:complete
MAILKMHYIGLDPVLREKARMVSDPTTPKMRKLVKDLVDSMHYYSGVGIAANQVGSTDRVCVIQLPEDDIPTVLFNLEITRKEGSREVIEGCLSLPGYQGRIERAEKVWARAIDENGVPVKLKAATELLAQALEHECDHLDGVLYTDLLKSNEDLWQVEIGMEEENEG